MESTQQKINSNSSNNTSPETQSIENTTINQQVNEQQQANNMPGLNIGQLRQILQKQNNSDDLRVREQIKKRDLYDIQAVKNDYEQEEKELKQFFTELKEPVKEDPTVIRRKRYQEKMGAYKEVLDDIDFKGLMTSFWYYQAHTPEEIETLALCRKKATQNIFLWSLLGLTVTTMTSYKYRHFMGFGMYALGFSVGVIGGGIMGIIRSTETVLKRFESLGPEFQLGRMAINEIEDFRMDKKKMQRV